MDLKVNNIFYSIQGETTRAGFPCLFIRLTGCNLNCNYCDAPGAKSNGKYLSIDSIIEKAENHRSADHITITGGEPLLQENSVTLVNRLIDAGFDVQVETNGSRDTANLPEKARKIIDIKTPSSGESNSFMMKNLECLSSKDELKFIIQDEVDYIFSKDFINTNLKKISCVINLSPVFNKISNKKLADFILDDKLSARFNIQLHKVIGVE